MDGTLLKGADFSGAKPQRAKLIGGMLVKARLDGADLSDADLGAPNA